MPVTEDGFVEPNNEDRAHWALAAVNTYSELIHNGHKVNEGDAEHAEEVMADLLADLRHLSKKLGVDFESANLRADINFTAEEAEQEMEAGQ
jgi:hypothetical protein